MYWHCVVGHPGKNAARKMLARGLGDVNGINVTQADYNKHEPWCDTCAKVNCRRSSHRARDEPDAGWGDIPNALHATDTMGKQKPSYWGDRYSTVVKDHSDGKLWVYAHKHKDDLTEILEEHEHQALLDGRKTQMYEKYETTIELPVKAYRHDRGGELMSGRERARRRRKGIDTQPTVPNAGHGQQNAVAERAIATLRRLSNKLIHSTLHNLDVKAKALWPYADAHAAKLIDLMPTRHNPGMQSPAERRYPPGKAALKESYIKRLYHLWGCRMIVHDPKDKRDLSGRDVIFVGVPDGYAPGYLGWDPDRPNKRPRVYLDVVFQEDARLDKQATTQPGMTSQKEQQDTSDELNESA